MISTCITRCFLITACCLAGVSRTYAEAVYTWVDPNGVTHFSENPPPEGGVPSSTIELAPLPPPPVNNDDYYSIMRQAERMEKRRLENEKLEAERLRAEAEVRRARMEAEAAAQAPAIYQDESTVYLPAYPYYPYGRGYGHKPRRPGDRPGGPGHWPNEPGYWPGPPGRPQPGPGPGFKPVRPRTISAIPPKP